MKNIFIVISLKFYLYESCYSHIILIHIMLTGLKGSHLFDLCTLVFLLAICLWAPCFLKPCTGRISQKSHIGPQRAMPGFCWLHSVLLIAADLWKLGNCTAERLLSSPAFPHSHFQRFQRFWSIDWWWRTAEARGSRVKALSLALSRLNESVMGLLPLLFIAETD